MFTVMMYFAKSRISGPDMVRDGFPDQAEAQRWIWETIQKRRESGHELPMRTVISKQVGELSL